MGFYNLDNILRNQSFYEGKSESFQKSLEGLLNVYLNNHPRSNMNRKINEFSKIYSHCVRVRTLIKVTFFVHLKLRATHTFERKLYGL